MYWGMHRHGKKEPAHACPTKSAQEGTILEHFMAWPTARDRRSRGRGFECMKEEDLRRERYMGSDGGCAGGEGGGEVRSGGRLTASRSS